jgi:hypothetical protein
MMSEPEKALATTPLGAGGIGRSATRRIAVRLLPFLFILYIVAFLDRMNVGAAALQMPHDLGLSDRAIGLGAGIFFRLFLAGNSRCVDCRTLERPAVDCAHYGLVGDGC